MIARLRRRHRWMTPLFLGAVPGIVLVAGISGRSPAPVAAEIPTVVSGVEDWDAPVAPIGRIWHRIGLVASLKRDSSRAQLVIETTEPALKPDLLVFWIPAAADMRLRVETQDQGDHMSTGPQLPTESVLLGALREAPSIAFDLPAQALSGESRFVLYSLPYREVVSVSKPVTLD